jgi:TonB family protein
LVIGGRGTAHAADLPVNSEPPLVAPKAVHVEVFKSSSIRAAPLDNFYPFTEIVDGREGWVQLSMMIDPNGKPYEAMVVESTGNPAFEKAALKALSKMSFEPARQGDVPVDSSLSFKMVFAIKDLEKGAAPEFVSAFKRLGKAIDAGLRTEADVQLVQLKSHNLYEEAFKNYGRFYYHRKWGSPSEQLEDLQLAIASEKNSKYLPKDAFVMALRAMFSLQVKARDFGGALESWNTLSPIATPSLRDELQPTVDQIHVVQLGSEPVSQSATIGNSSHWLGTMFRNRFSINVHAGAVNEIKLRCAKQYLFFKYMPGVEYSIGARKDQCGLEVVGDPETTFDLVQ